MADFCFDCTEKLGITGDKNDFVGFPGWQLCEGCGKYVFVDSHGKRQDYPEQVVEAELEPIGESIPFNYYTLPWYERFKIFLKIKLKGWFT